MTTKGKLIHLFVFCHFKGRHLCVYLLASLDKVTFSKLDLFKCSKLFPLRVWEAICIGKGSSNRNGRVVSPESLPIYQWKECLILSETDLLVAYAKRLKKLFL